MKRKRTTKEPVAILQEVRRLGSSLTKGGDTVKVGAIIRGAFVFALSFLLGAVNAPMGTYPYSYAVLTAASGGVDTALAFIGAVFATVTMDTGGLLQVVILTGLLLCRSVVFLARGELRDRRTALRKIFRERGYIRTVAATAGAAAFGCVTIVNSADIYYGLFSALLGIGETAIVTASLVFFSDRKAKKAKRAAGLAVLAAGLSMACNVFPLPFSLSAVVTFLFTVYFSYAGGALMGITVGAAAGLAVGIEYSAAFASVGLVCALLWESSRIGSVVTSALSACVLSLFGGGLSAISDVIPEIALAAAVAAPFVSLGPIPETLPAFLSFDEPIPSDPDALKARGKRMCEIGDALESLSKMIRSISSRLRLPTKQEAHTICTSARAKFCSGCANEKDCSGADKRTVDSMFLNMAHRLTTNGRVSAKIVPESVARRCYNIDQILDTVNARTRKAASLSGGVKSSELFASDYSALASLVRAAWEDESAKRDEEAEASLSAALSGRGFSFSGASVYGKRARRIYMRDVDLRTAGAGERDICECACEILGQRLSAPEFSIDGKSVNASMHSLPVIQIETGKHALRSKRDNQSGDSACTFENGEGYFYSLVSDGMGSGREAAVTSGISAAFLEKLLSAGCPMRSALEMLNSYVRASSGECFTTVDLMEADLYTGRARFIKSGAAPSFVIRRGQLYRIHSKTVPVGIMRALDAEAVSFDLMAGDTVIMMSDGVSGSYEESPWLYDLLSDEIYNISSPCEIAQTIAKSAAENTGREDDITVCVLKVRKA